MYLSLPSLVLLVATSMLPLFVMGCISCILDTIYSINCPASYPRARAGGNPSTRLLRNPASYFPRITATSAGTNPCSTIFGWNTWSCVGAPNDGSS